MFGLRKTLFSLAMVVIFLVLASFATVFYNADQEQKNELVNNNLVQKSGETLGVIVGVSEKMTEVNVQKNIGLGKTMADFIGRIDWQWLLMGTSTKEVESTNNGIENSDVNSDMTVSDEQSFDEFAPDNVSAPAEDNGFWAKLKTSAKEEWENSQTEDTAAHQSEDINFGQNLFSYQKTNIGAEIIITPKSGDEYKVPLPFSFLR